ncbi:titin-like isoform X2 [Hyposmocoma kahamanoa]|uniref:titin-like isoform X2 n=1 Tax=Hyposmocoma kahamanoa TaxID=1477025 RepID=UPI000E6D63F2|nr:titin-like isoform X2 [Hyposmocoma kahamanoa]
MCEQTEINYLDGDVVWVKLGSCWWPGEVVGPERLPPDVLPSFRKPPIAVVKFYQEDTYEYVKNINYIYKYNCSRKNEFINKGLYMYRSKPGHNMEKFPEDVIRAETAVGGDIEILTRDEFQEVKKESYKEIFIDPAKKTTVSGKGTRLRQPIESPKASTPSKQLYKEKCDYKVHILLQGSKDKEATSQPADSSTPSTSRAGSEVAEEKEESPKVETSVPVTPTKSSMPSTPVASSSGCYSCPSCNFSTTRLNVLIMHNKTHSVTYMPYTPSPVRKKPVAKPVKSPPKLSKTPKIPRPRKDKSDKYPKKSQGKKRTTDDKVETKNVKKPKTDEEIKSSLLADWDDADEDSNDESPGLLLSRSPEIPVGAESPAAPIPAELPRDLTSPVEKKFETESTDKPESSSDSKYEFCEDEDWPEEADAGRKIPRVKNPSKRKEETKSLSVEDDIDVAKEVAELLNKTTVPELPSVPEPLKVEENFPEPSIVKSPDKKPDAASAESSQPDNTVTTTKPTKTIFKTKTFFRSRHSRSQDAIGKYVAEQLNAAERMDLSETELNGSEAVSSPEARESPPVEPVKVARLAPKIQLKKMKAEAAQKEKIEAEQFTIDVSKSTNENIVDNSQIIHSKPLLDVLYPTQEIKPISKELPDKLLQNEDNGEDQNCTVLDNVEKMNVDTNKDTIESQYRTVDSIYPSNSTTMPEKFLEASPEKAPEDQQVEIEPMVIEENITSTPKKGQFDLKIRNTKETKIKFVVDDDVENNISKVENIVKQSTSNPGILPRLSVCPKKSRDTPTFTEDAIKTSPQKSNDSLKELPPLTNFQKQQNLLKSFQPLIQPYMNESTASAVDALLSVSRETDRVPRIVSNDLPEDLFEDDNKESGPADNCIGDNIVEEVSVNQVGNKKMEIDQPNEVNVATDNEVLHVNIIQKGLTDDATNLNENVVTDVVSDIVKDNLPSESDLQIAETLINLPSSAIQNNATEHEDIVNVPNFVENEEIVEEIVPASDNVVNSNIFEAKVVDTAELETESPLIPNNKNLNIRFETEQEKSENLNAAQSLVQMSESMDHKINIAETKVIKKKDLPSPTIKTKQNNGLDKTVEQKVALLSTENSSDPSTIKSPKFETTSSKLLKILEEPPTVKVPVNKTAPIKQTTPVKQVVVSGKEKILNFDVAKSSMKGKPQTTKQKIIIRRTGPPKNLMNINNLSEVVASPDKIILSRSNMAAQDGSSVQTFTIQASPDVQTDPKQIIIQPKIRKITKTATKPHKIKPQESLVVQPTESKIMVNNTSAVNEPMFDINSMPVVLSDDILTPESIEKMPIVMSDGNLITTNPPNPPKLIKTKPSIIENEKITISPPSKPEVKTLLMNTSSDMKSNTPNILSKSSKLRAAKPMLVIDKATGKQKIIMTKSEPIVKEIKPAATLIQQVPQTAAKTEKFIILPTTSSPRTTGRTQKIVIDPQTGKAHVLVTKGQEPALSVAENKPVSAKLIQSSSDTANPGNTVMIITNAQGAQSRIVLTPEHEKILFPNKQQPNVSQLKTITQRISTNTPVAPKTIVSTTHVKAQTKIVPKQQKSAIITSKGQLIVGGRVATATQNIAPMPEIRPALKPVPKRIVASEPKKLVQAIQKTTSEPLIFLQQKSGAVMQLTAAQFEHLQRTGQIVQKVTAPVQENKIMQKSITISPKEPIIQPVIQKQRVRKSVTASPSPAKKVKQEIAIAPAPAHIPTPVLLPTPTPVVTPTPSVPLPPLTSLSNTTLTATASISNNVPAVSNTVSVSTTQNYTELDNFEELLPSTAIARQSEPTIVVPQPEPAMAQVEPVAEPPQAQLSDGQLLAVPGENFGGPPGSFYLCVEDNGTLTPIDNRPLVLENNQLVPMTIEPAPVFAPQPERRDILEAALANSDVFHADTSRDEAPDFRDLNANVSVHCRVSETSTTLNQPIMTPVEVPTKAVSEPTTVPSNLEDGLAVIGVTPQTVPTSLELPITVTDPRIAPKTTDPLSNSNYATSLLTSPNTEMDFTANEEAEVAGPISMPLLTDEETVGKSMPILTDDVAERTVSSVESTVGSPSSIEVRESEAEEGATWAGARRLLTPGSDTSENSAEIPLQPAIQLSVNDLSRHS